MGKKYCMPRNVLLVFLVLQLISTIERQIFDFLGYMWIPILGNFFNIVFVIFGLFGLYQYRSNYILAYTLWTVFSLGFNAFIVCYYLDVGDLDSDDDILSFGTGSFSWWLVNSPGCQPHYNTTKVPENANHPLKPSFVVGCHMRYQDIEVTHAAIQIVISGVGLLLAVYTTHYYMTVINPKREKQGVKAMYSIEYSPSHRDTSNPNTLERETDMQSLENGVERHQASAMTPRRVKRRSYRNSTRSHKEKSMSRKENHNRLSLPKSARTSARSHKSINPVTRLIDADQNRADSSTSNEAERYGQINPGFQGDASRPNSIYNLSGPPTDMEASRPQSALTSYSNFHPAQRRVVGGSSAQPRVGPLPQGVTSLTQESLMNHEQTMNSSFDDLPPPPPPISSSPAPPDDDAEVSESDNCSSVATAQIPVPQQRSSIRRNEYVNIPIPPRESPPVPAIISHQEPEPQAPGPKPAGGHMSSLTAPLMGPPPVPPHNYANLPSGQQQGHAGARPRPSNPLYGKKEEVSNYPSYIEVERREPKSVYGPRGSYEAETLRSDSKMMLPPSYTLVAEQQQGGESGQFKQFESGQYGGRPPVPPSPRESVSDNQSDRYAQIQDYNPQPETRYYQEQQPAQINGHHNGFPEPERLKNRENDSGIHSMEPSGTSESQAPLKRVPNGHAARDRASLRLKQRKEMEAKAAAGRAAKLNGGSSANVPTYVNSSVRPEDEYGFSSGPSSKLLPNGRPANGYADMSGSKPAEVDDKWYLKDSMRPVGASNHGMNCKCYRCQRKLTAI